MSIKSRYSFILRTTQIQSTTYITPPLRPILILSSHLSLGGLRRVFPSAFPMEILNAYIFYSTRLTNPSNRFVVRMIALTTCGAQHILFIYPFHNCHQPISYIPTFCWSFQLRTFLQPIIRYTQHNSRVYIWLQNRFLPRCAHHCAPKHSWIQWTHVLSTYTIPTDINVLQYGFYHFRFLRYRRPNYMLLYTL
jgi:hypothetical protein